MTKIKHSGVRETVKTIVGYKSRWMKTDQAMTRLEGVRDVVMNSVEMEMMDLYVIGRLMQAWSRQRYAPLMELVSAPPPTSVDLYIQKLEELEL